MQPSFPSFWRTHHYYPSWPHISQDSLCTTALSQRKKKNDNGEIKWRRFNNDYNDNITVGSNNRSTAPRCSLNRKHTSHRKSYFSSSSRISRTKNNVDAACEGLSKGVAFKGCKGCSPWIGTQLLFLFQPFVCAHLCLIS